jgi:hypothetical protein
MSELLPIITGLIVISALAVVASNDKKDTKDKDLKEVKEKKENKPKEKKDDDDFGKILGYFKKQLSAEKKPKRHYKVYSKGKTKRNTEGYSYRIVKPISK